MSIGPQQCVHAAGAPMTATTGGYGDVSPPHPGTAGAGECPNCRRSFGHEMPCQFCGQVDSLPVGVVLSPGARRFGGHLLSVLLAVVTLGVGYLVWTLILYGRGQ